MGKRYTFHFKSIAFFLFLFCQQIFAQQNKGIIDANLKGERDKYGLSANDIKEYRVSNEFYDAKSGLTYTYIQQLSNNIPVFNAISVVLIKENNVVYSKLGMVKNISENTKNVTPLITPEAAITSALSHLGINNSIVAKQLSNNSATGHISYDLPTVSPSPIGVQLVYLANEKGIYLAWDVSIEMKNLPNWWNIRIDAMNGRYLEKNDWNVSCNFDANSSHQHGKTAVSVPQKSNLILPNISSKITAPASGQYNVFPFPLEAPTFGSRSLLTDPHDVLASPFGWHDTNGAVGAEHTITRGNNVFAYSDEDANNLPGDSPDGSAGLIFDFPYVNAIGNPPVTNKDAATTNLFYANNRIHDVLYHTGFNEIAGNFQQKNYSNQGYGNDAVNAESLDGLGTNNANFRTPPEGTNPRMQMYVWSSGGNCSNLNIASSGFNGTMGFGTSTFGSGTAFTGEIVLINDGVDVGSDGCTAIVNNVAGKIALIDRGTCTFLSKAQTAVTAGAIGVIIVNNVAGAAPGMTGSPAVTIPVISVSLSDGNILKAQLLLGTVTATFSGSCTATFDGSFDNGIIAHEYGHGVSNRLTGGPFNSSCVSNAESGGEGWSDWLALIMTTKASDVPNILTQAKGIGTYVLGQPTSGAGIRRFRYSYDMAINPQTYATVATSSGVHAIGEIWCSAIWDMTSLLINQFGFNADPTNTTAGNNIAMKLVLEGMKLQPCSPGFLDARDAILQADAIFYNNAHRCLIWDAFARRGMGTNAIQGLSTSSVDQTAGFNKPSICTTAPTQSPSAAFISNSSTIECASTVQFTDQSIEPNTWLWEFGDGTTSTVQNPSHQYNSPGSYSVKLTVTNSLGSNNITNQITVNPAFTATITATPETVVCGEPVQLNVFGSGSSNISYIVNSIPYAPLTGTITNVLLGDEQSSTALPIGFNFNFYGNNYSSFYINSNGYISFDPNTPANVFGIPIPAKGTPNNLIALAWNDLDPSIPGSIVGYFVSGVAPNRKLIVQFNTNHYGTREVVGNPSYPFIVQAILSEGSNEIEIHTDKITDPVAYNQPSPTSQGIENADGSQGVGIPGRNYAIVTVITGEAYRFTPAVRYNYEWTANNFMGASQTVNPISSTTYNVKVSDGSGCVQTFTSPLVNITAIVPTISGNEPFCQGTTIVLDAGAHASYLWSNGATTQTIMVSTASTFTVTVTDANTCSGTASVTTSFKPFIDCCINNPIVINSNNSGSGSLRQAVLDACPGSIITFQMAASLVTSPISLIDGRIIIDKNLTIQGPGASQLTVQNTAAIGPNSYVFHVNNGITATITDLTISGGNVNTPNAGGGITNFGDLTISKLKITNNNSLNGGGVLNKAKLTINQTTVANNNATTGGGLRNLGTIAPAPLLTISNSTISGNFASQGAGIQNENAILDINNSTIANNIGNGASSYGGGGVENIARTIPSSATFTNVTLSGNQYQGTTGTFADEIFSGSFGADASVTLKNSIINGTPSTTSPNLQIFTEAGFAQQGSITSSGYNLSSDGGSGLLIGTSDIINQNPQLGPLQNNGGETNTMALLTGSPAINAGNCDLATDQRGITRTAPGPCDIGSFESNTTPLPVTLISLSVKKRENYNLLKWKVAKEIALDGYEIQKSEDGKSFEKIGFVKGIEASDYQYLDKNSNINFNNSFAPNISYYKLKMLENDGKFNFSKIVSIENEIEKATVSNFYPNPPTDKAIFVDIAVNQADIWLTNLVGTNGILHKTKTIALKKGINKVPFEISNLPKGIYFVKFINNLKQEVVRKFIVE